MKVIMSYVSVELNVVLVRWSDMPKIVLRYTKVIEKHKKRKVYDNAI